MSNLFQIIHLLRNINIEKKRRTKEEKEDKSILLNHFGTLCFTKSLEREEKRRKEKRKDERRVKNEYIYTPI